MEKKYLELYGYVTNFKKNSKPILRMPYIKIRISRYFNYIDTVEIIQNRSTFIEKEVSHSSNLLRRETDRPSRMYLCQIKHFRGREICEK